MTGKNEPKGEGESRQEKAAKSINFRWQQAVSLCP